VDTITSRARLQADGLAYMTGKQRLNSWDAARMSVEDTGLYAWIDEETPDGGPAGHARLLEEQLRAVSTLSPGLFGRIGSECDARMAVVLNRALTRNEMMRVAASLGHAPFRSICSRTPSASADAQSAKSST
jgi:hypothetical protein